jgi:hypothetical protein
MAHRPPTVTRTALVVLSFTGILLVVAGAAVWLGGGIRTDIFGLRLRATDPLRPIWIGVACIGARLLGLRALALDAEVHVLRSLFRAPVIAAALAVLITAVGFGTNYGVGGGSDSYGYVSEADLWLDGDLTVKQDWLRDAPWPHALLSAAPLGYRPATTGLAIVPVYPPGLPLLLAGGKVLFGPCGIVVVIATMAGLLVAATYGIGRRLASPQVGAAAAWLVATCPVVLFMMASPMSDVPAAALAALTMYGCVRPSRTSAFLAGLSMALVILIRPNLAPLVAFIGFWLLVMDRQTPTWRARIERCAVFGAGVAPGAVGMAMFNSTLYGSASASGYGDLGGFFSASYILPNIRNYSQWLFESQTPVVALGLLALFAPARWVAKTHRVASASLLLMMAAGLTAIYLPYMVFDQWWYLRFFLPAWPALAIGTAWLCTNDTGRAYGRSGILMLLIVGGWGLHFAQSNAAFRVGWGDLRYVSAAHAVGEMTPPGSVILSMQHSGSVSYYGGRRSLRYDQIERHRLDDVVHWLKAKGYGVYILVEEWEVEHFRARFKDRTYGALADETLVFRQDVGTRVLLFDTRSHDGEMVRTITTFMPSALRCCEPRR